MTLYKVLQGDRSPYIESPPTVWPLPGDDGTPGAWLDAPEGTPGFHLTYSPTHHTRDGRRAGWVVYEAETSGLVFDEHADPVARRVRLLRRVDDPPRLVSLPPPADRYWPGDGPGPPVGTGDYAAWPSPGGPGRDGGGYVAVPLAPGAVREGGEVYAHPHPNAYGYVNPDGSGRGDMRLEACLWRESDASGFGDISPAGG